MLKSKPETQSLQLLRGFRLSVGGGLCRRPLSPFGTQNEGLNLDPILEPFWDPFWKPLGAVWGQGGQARRQKTEAPVRVYFQTPAWEAQVSSSELSPRWEHSFQCLFWATFGTHFDTILAPSWAPRCPTHLQKGSREPLDLSPYFGPRKASERGGFFLGEFGTLFGPILTPF